MKFEDYADPRFSEKTGGESAYEWQPAGGTGR